MRLFFLFLSLSVSYISNSHALEKVCFAPGSCCEKEISKMIMKSKNNINLAVKDIASYNIYRHLIRACERGVKIKILADKESFQSKASFLYALKMSCVDVITSPINDIYIIYITNSQTNNRKI